MGWFNRLGNAIKGGVQRLGKKVHEGIDAGVRLVEKVAPIAHKVAAGVSSAAGVVGKVASMAAPMLAGVPKAGALAQGVAQAAKAVQGGATTFQGGVNFVQKAADTAKNIQKS